ncbi:MAG: CocE/NonD family hydrolase [Deltaproteobacteria bacterium]|nr:CocE/NonD family hydrolase [Deltaproteobacteria bacterium]
MARFRSVLTLTALTLLQAACSSDDSGGKGGSSDDGGAGGGGGGGGGDAGAKVPDVTEKATFVAGGSIGQVWVTDAEPGDELLLVDGSSREVARGTADRLGSFIFREIQPGEGYTVRLVEGDKVYGTDPLPVLARTDVPDASLYEQVLKPGLNYVKMRDGIELAMTVRLPMGKTEADGPFPTMIEYSGYQVAAPGNLLDAAVGAVLGGGGLGGLNDPLLPATSTAVGSLILPFIDFAVVSVQMRGSGCSGGDYQLFDVPSTYDGYDAVEVVAAQDWVKGGKVGLAGISFSGISQLFVGGARPPHLAAVSPMSVTDDIYLGTGFPGGIFNNGFAKSWLNERMDNAKPAPEDGAQAYAVKLVQDGDQHCIDNQKLRAQTQDVFELLANNPFYTPSLVEDRTPANWAEKIDVPVFLVGMFQDEQTGGHFPEMLSRLAENPNVWVTLGNGVHVDSLGPATITRWAEFLNLFVADRIPVMPELVASVGGQLYSSVANGSPSMAIPPTRFDAFTDVALAREEFKKDQRVRLLMDSGSGPAGPGALESVWELGYDSWPVKEATARTFFLGDAGKLAAAAPSGGEVSYTGDPSKRPLQTLGGSAEGDAWAALPPYTWAPVAEGAGLGFSTDPLTEDVVMAGTSSLDLEVQSSAADTDIQVTLSDVRPDGKEMYVQSGWIRATHRTVDAARSTATNPVQLHLEADSKPMPSGAFETVRVQIYPVAYAFRKDHRIRVTVQAPGGDRARWRFETIEDGTITNKIKLGASKLVLPVVPGAVAGAPLPACPSNRGQPCRDYAAAGNGG